MLRKFLAGEDPVLALLREQYEHLSLARRFVSDDSLHLEFAHPVSSAALELPDLMLADVWIELEGFPDGADATLWIRNGRLHALELSVVEGDWPEAPELTRLAYAVRRFRGSRRLVPAVERDLRALQLTWRGP